MLLGTLDASLLVNILAGEGINRAGEEIVRAGYGNKKGKGIAKAALKMSFISVTYRNKRHF